MLFNRYYLLQLLVALFFIVACKKDEELHLTCGLPEGNGNSISIEYFPENEDSLKSLSKDVGYAGAVITIEGENFSTTLSENEVFFNLEKATVLTATDTTLNVMVPEGGESGKVWAKVNNDTLANPLDFDYYT